MRHRLVDCSKETLRPQKRTMGHNLAAPCEIEGAASKQRWP